MALHEGDGALNDLRPTPHSINASLRLMDLCVVLRKMYVDLSLPVNRKILCHHGYLGYFLFHIDHLLFVLFFFRGSEYCLKDSGCQ